MTKFHSHYDNLRVTRNAPEAVIKAAYRTLSQQYHPDLSSDPDAARIMTILNGSYDVLRDPVKRRAHDDWIARQEHAASPPPPPRQRAPTSDTASRAQAPRRRQPAPPAHAAQRANAAPRFFSPRVARLARALPLLVWLTLAALAALVGFAWWPSIQPAAPQGAAPTAFSPAPAGPPTPRAAPLTHAPNGAAWPGAAGYVFAYPVAATGGYSTLAIDNTRNDFDVYVKLVEPGAPPGTALRHVFIPRRATFTMEDVAAGDYEVRYRNLASGSAATTAPFALDETRSDDGVRYSQVTFTLYSVAHGNTRMQPLALDQF